MIFKIALFILPHCFSGMAAGQDTSNNLSLNAAISVAISNRHDLKMQQINSSISENNIKEVRTRDNPQLTLDVDMRINIQLQTNILPGDLFGPSGTLSKAVRFGTRYNTLPGISLNQTIFSPTNRADKKIAEAQYRYQQVNEIITEHQIRLEVTSAYFTVLLWQKKVVLSETNLTNAREIDSIAKTRRKTGAITEYDLHHDDLDLLNAQSQDNQNINNLNLAIEDLRYKMGLPDGPEVKLTDSLEGLFNKSTKYPEIDSIHLKRPELLQEKLQLGIDELNIKKQRSAYLPSISLYANYSENFLSDNLDYVSNHWYPFSYAGIKVSWSIFDGGLKRQTIREYSLRSELSRETYQKLQSDYLSETKTSLIALANATEDFGYQENNLKLANKLYKIDLERLKNGAIKYTDLSNTYYSLQQSQVNYLNAVYNYLVALVQYKKAVGSL